MAFCDKLVGKYVDLVCAEKRDAQFTIDIRNDKTLTHYIPVLKVTIDEQSDWIQKQLEADFDVFFVIKKHSGEPIGTLSYYDYVPSEKTCEIGRYISKGNAFDNIEAVLLMLNKLFSDNKVEKVLLNIHEDNTAVISLWKRFGAQFYDMHEMGGWRSAQYYLFKEHYWENVNSISNLLRL